MKYTFLLFLVFFAQKFSLAQDPDSLSKIIFEYTVGRDATNSGIYSITEIIELSRESNQTFTINIITRISNWHNKDRTKYKHDTSRINLQKIRKTALEVGYLINQLNTAEDNFNIHFILPNLTNPSKKSILAVAKKSNKKWYFQRKIISASQ